LGEREIGTAADEELYIDYQADYQLTADLTKSESELRFYEIRRLVPHSRNVTLLFRLRLSGYGRREI
jgi:hypothetical protein